SSICSFVRELARLTKNHKTRPMTSTTTDTIKDAKLSTPEFNTSFISHLAVDATFYHRHTGRKSTDAKRGLPGDKFIDRTNSAEKLHILIAHDVYHLRPKHQTGKHNYDQNKPPKLFHFMLHINKLLLYASTTNLNRG